MRRLLTLLLSAMTVLLAAAPVAAQPAPGGEADAVTNPGGGGSVTVGVTVPGGGAPAGATEGGVSSSTGHVTFYWRSAPGSSCAGLGAEGPGVGVPELYEFVRHDRSTNPVTIEVLDASCFPPEAAPETPPPPPPPPTLAEMNALAQEQILPPELTLSPAGDGLTGLPTHFWYEGQTEVSASATIRGYTVTASMTPRYVWNTGETSRRGHVIGSTVPGSPTTPAASWTYDTAGQYDVSLSVVWNGTWSFTGEGQTASGSLATVEVAAGRDYTVNQIHSVLSG